MIKNEAVLSYPSLNIRKLEFYYYNICTSVSVCGRPRFEDMADEGDHFLQHLHAPPTIRQRKDNVFSGAPTSEVSCSYYTQLSSHLMQKLHNKYRPDLQLFGYTIDQYLKCTEEDV